MPGSRPTGKRGLRSTQPLFSGNTRSLVWTPGPPERRGRTEIPEWRESPLSALGAGPGVWAGTGQWPVSAQKGVGPGPPGVSAEQPLQGRGTHGLLTL